MTKPLIVDFHMSIQIDDEMQFRQQAADAAKASELSHSEDYLDEDITSLGQCAIMLFDPGESPQGCSILDSWGE